MKQITIAGNVGKDAVVRRTQGGDAVASWSVAVEERSGQDKKTVWFDVSLWGSRGEARAPYITKGTRVCVAGELGTREHDGKTYFTIRADQVTLMGGGEKRDADPARQAPDHRQDNRRDDMDDAIPF